MLVSFGLSSVARLLGSLDFTEKYILFYDVGSNRVLQTNHVQQLSHILAFDFFSRLLFFSVYWYTRLYKPDGTYKPEWLEILR
jgi:hypothetical protein